MEGTWHAGQSDAVASELDESLAALGQFVVTERSLRESLHRVAELSVGAVYGADGAGVTWVVSGTPTTVSAAGEIVRRFDEIQYAFDEGPCLEAYRTQKAVLVENLAGEAKMAALHGRGAGARARWRGRHPADRPR